MENHHQIMELNLGNLKQFSNNIKDSHPGFTLDPVSSIKTEDIKLGRRSYILSSRVKDFP